MKSVPTFTAQIYVGLQEGYEGKTHNQCRVECICQEFVDEVGWCVSITRTRFVYKDGKESGVIVGIINYPRFPMEIKELKDRTLKLANILMTELNQNRISVVFPDETIMLENTKLIH